MLIGMACRNGGKSLGVAGLNLADMSQKKNCGIVSIAGNFQQAQRGYQHVLDMLKKDQGLASMLADRPVQKRTGFINGSSLEILTASERSVHSPHVPKLRIDEVDLVPADIYQGSLSIPISTPDVGASIVMTSTRFKAYGQMYNLVEDAESMKDQDVRVRKWCIREVMEKCPYQYARCPMRRCEDFCDGKWCKKAEGFYKVEDVFTKFISMEDETWRTQWMVEKPSRFGLVYPHFGSEHVVTDEDLPPYLRLDSFKNERGEIRLDPQIRPNWTQPFTWGAGIDYGFEDPFVCVLAARLPNDTVYILDEIYYQHLSPSQVVERVERRFPMLINRLYSDPTYNEYEPAAVYSDPSDPAWAREFAMRNFLMVPRPYDMQEGISLLRRFMKPPAMDVPKIFIHERCKKLRQELNSYANKEDSDIPMDDNNHGPDALRYYMQGNFMPLKVQIEQMMTWTPEKHRIQQDLDFDIPGSLFDDD